MQGGPMMAVPRAGTRKERRVVLITGANIGIGAQTARKLAARGDHVVMACRNQRAAEEMANRIRDELGGDASIEVGPRLDLTDRESIRDFAAKFKAAHDRLDVLINNAGMGPMPDEKTADGVVIMVQTNYLGPYQLTRLLEDVLAKTAAAHGSARIVNVSSITHRLAFIPKVEDFLRVFKRGQYAHTKLANVLFTYEAQRRYAALGIENCAVDPGGVKSDIWNKQAEKLVHGGPIRWMIKAFYAPVEDGCSAVVHAATMDWAKDKRSVRPEEDLRFYARGMFASPLVTWAPSGGGRGLSRAFWSLAFLIASLCDYPMRFFTGEGRRQCT